MLEKITDYLKKKDWTFTYGKTENSLTFSIKGFNANFHCFVDISDEFFLFITYSGTLCPSDKRLQLAELLIRIDNNLKYGNYEMGMEGGEIKFRTCICHEGIELNETVIDNIVMRNINIHDYSFPILAKFLFGEIAIEDVYNTLFPPPLLENKEVKQIEE